MNTFYKSFAKHKSELLTTKTRNSQISHLLNLNFRTDLLIFAKEFCNYKGESVLEIFAVCISMLESAWITLLASFFIQILQSYAVCCHDRE